MDLKQKIVYVLGAVLCIGLLAMLGVLVAIVNGFMEAL